MGGHPLPSGFGRAAAHPPIVRAAIAALDLFGASSAREARSLLGMWARRHELSDVDVAEVLAYYDRPARAIQATRHGAEVTHQLAVDGSTVARLVQHPERPPLIEVLHWDPANPSPNPADPDEVLILTLPRAANLARAIRTLVDQANAGGGSQ